MAKAKSPLLKILVGDGGSPEAFTLLAGISSKSVPISNNPIDVTTDEDVNLAGVSFATFLSGRVNVAPTGQGITFTTAATRVLRQAALTGEVKNYRVEYPDGDTLTGPMFVSEFSDAGEVNGAATYNISLQLAGAPTYVAATLAPANLLLPSIAGTAQQGVALTAVNGLWTGGNILYSYQWQNDGGSATWANIVGATSRTYTPVAGDVGDRLRVIVTAANPAGPATATSSGTAAVLAP